MDSKKIKTDDCETVESEVKGVVEKQKEPQLPGLCEESNVTLPEEDSLTGQLEVLKSGQDWGDKEAEIELRR